MKFIKHILIASTAFFSTAFSASACDFCGCAPGGNYTGIFPQFNKNIIGIRHRHQSFTHPRTALNFNGESQVLSDRFGSTELWGRFYPHPRIQVFVTVPYRVHERAESLRETTIEGIGDISAMANYALINTGDSLNRNFKHTLLLGGGVKLPTGKYQQRDATRAVLPAQFQVGTGGYAVTANVNYTLRYKNLGVNTDFSYRHNTENEWSYRFGAQTAAVANLFYWIDAGKTAILPSAGMAFERYEKDTEYGFDNLKTGGDVLLANAGVDIYFPRFFVQINVQKPTEQDLPFAQPRGEWRLAVSVAYTF